MHVRPETHVVIARLHAYATHTAMQYPLSSHYKVRFNTWPWSPPCSLASESDIYSTAFLHLHLYLHTHMHCIACTSRQIRYFPLSICTKTVWLPHRTGSTVYRFCYNGQCQPGICRYLVSLLDECMQRDFLSLWEMIPP